MSKVTVEFLESYGFKQNQFPDGFFWIKFYKVDSYIQVSDCLSIILEEDNGWIEQLTAEQFIDTVVANQKAIDQE